MNQRTGACSPYRETRRRRFDLYFIKGQINFFIRESLCQSVLSPRAPDVNKCLKGSYVLNARTQFLQGLDVLAWEFTGNPELGFRNSMMLSHHLSDLTF